VRAARTRAVGLAAATALALAPVSTPRVDAVEGPRFPDVLLVTIDTLRADRLSAAGYARPTSPVLDRLFADGFRFTGAYTVEPLTNPALATLLTSLPPHEHGATRNGLPVRSGLVSLSKLLARRGYRTAAFVGSWTLKPRLSGLAEHWQTYVPVVSRKRWFGLFKDEARGRDLTDAALAWLDRRNAEEPERPFLLWVHYVEPHAPYRMHASFATRLGIDPRRATPSERYDTEIAAVDAEIGHLIGELDGRRRGRDRLTVVLADHGEAFGEDGELGHGRRLHASTLRIPFAVVGPGRVPAGASPAPVTMLDVAPTLLGLLGLPVHPYFRGRDLGPVLRGGALPDSSPCLQAHRGAVQAVQVAERARRAGLLEVGLARDGRLETLRLAGHEAFSRPFGARVPAGGAAIAEPAPSRELTACLEEIRAGLGAADRYEPPALDAEAAAELRALGYLD